MDTGAAVACVDDRLIKAFRLPTEPATTRTYSGITGRTASNTCATFPVEIGGREIRVYATVLPALDAGLLLGMNTLQAYDVDVLAAKAVVRIAGTKVPMVNRRITMREYRAIRRNRVYRKMRKILSFFLLFALVSSAVAAVGLQGRASTLTRRLRRGEMLARDDFLYVLGSVDGREGRRWRGQVTEDEWRNARWDAYCRNEDVDVVLSERFGEKISTVPLLRWEREPEEAAVMLFWEMLGRWGRGERGFDYVAMFGGEGFEEWSIWDDMKWVWDYLTWRWRPRPGDDRQQ